MAAALPYQGKTVLLAPSAPSLAKVTHTWPRSLPAAGTKQVGRYRSARGHVGKEASIWYAPSRAPASGASPFPCFVVQPEILKPGNAETQNRLGRPTCLSYRRCHRQYASV